MSASAASSVIIPLGIPLIVDDHIPLTRWEPDPDDASKGREVEVAFVRIEGRIHMRPERYQQLLRDLDGTEFDADGRRRLLDRLRLAAEFELARRAGDGGRA